MIEMEQQAAKGFALHDRDRSNGRSKWFVAPDDNNCFDDDDRSSTGVRKNTNIREHSQ